MSENNRYNINKHKTLSPEELFRLMDADESDVGATEVDDFEREAMEGLKLLKDRQKTLQETNARIDTLLEEEKNKKTGIPHQRRNNLYILAVAASLFLMVGLFFIFKYSGADDKITMAQETKSEAAAAISDSVGVTAVAPLVNSDESIGYSQKQQSETSTGKPAGIKQTYAWSAKSGKDVNYKIKDIAADSGEAYNYTMYNQDKREAGNDLLKDEADRLFSKSEPMANPATKPLATNTATLHVTENQSGLTNQVNGMVNTEKNSSGAGATVEDSYKNAVAGRVNNELALNKNADKKLNEVRVQKSNASGNSARKSKKGKFKRAKLLSSTPAYAYNDKETKSRKEEDLKRESIAEGRDMAMADTFVQGKVELKKSAETFSNDNNGALLVADQMPEYPGGNTELVKYIQKNIQFTESDNVSGVSGRFTLSFIVKEDGSLSNISVSKGAENCPICREKIVNGIKAMPRWIPGRNKGVTVSVWVHKDIYVNTQ